MQEWELSQEQIQEKINNMVWSFSRVKASSNCMYCWYLSYIEELKSESNGYAQFGSFCHKILEMFFKGELSLFELSDYYIEHYHENVTYDFPANKYVDLAQKTYEQGLEYFNNFSFDFDKYEVLGVEKEVVFNVGEYKVRGYIDLLLRDKETKEITVIDHKTKSFKYLKNGNVSKTDLEHFDGFKKQEYIYSIPLIEKYGRVDYLAWNMIRDNRIIKIPFDDKEYKETIEWYTQTIEKIQNEKLWLPDTRSNYFCEVLCNQRNNCFYR